MSLSPFGLFRRKQAFSRSATRHSCQIDCELVLTDSMAAYDGRLIDISTGGAMFRPRLAYLMNRRNEPVELRLDGFSVLGEIVATVPAGFGIRFEHEIDEQSLLALLARHADPARRAA
ncbi:PilZ domain-containing protein [Novosphingobium piscinae]|uniref:PilZ domain-containing protein n=1 Tax=Novosphingobium piscinae TaxID=1507448 RepID=A0A7X1FVY2_9SPHN|nr:PilZ domain-containing protein [Novosphingobium piscinae]MBC2667984.1 PilZ domain-containing protein [Novosphingobium piscinae]